MKILFCAFGALLRQSTIRNPQSAIGSPRHRAAGDPAGGPGGLEIEAAGQAVYVKKFAGEMEAGANPAFHGFEIHLSQAHAAAGNEFVLVQALAGHREFGADELLDERVPRRARQASRSGSRGAMPAARTSCVPRGAPATAEGAC